MFLSDLVLYVCKYIYIHRRKRKKNWKMNGAFTMKLLQPLVKFEIMFSCYDKNQINRKIKSGLAAETVPSRFSCTKSSLKQN